MQTFEARTAVVTGAASGIGLALSQRFYDEGMNVVMVDIEEGTLQAAASGIGGDDRLLTVTTDVGSEQAVEVLAETVYQHYGAVHVLCNNAGVFTSGASWECSSADYRWLIDVNVMGIAHALRSFVPRMIAAGEEGHIVNTASMAAMTTMPFSSVYCMSKAAALSLSECLFKELEIVAPQLGVSVLCPELINTGIAAAARNRPAAYSGDADLTDTEFSRMTNQAITEGTAGGLDPAVMAERVLQGIVDRQFYLLAKDAWKDIALTRQDEIRAETNPTLAVFEP